jgi:hypothetical protein
VRANDDELPKKLLGAWMHQQRKIDGQQLLCDNSFARAVHAVIPTSSQNAKDYFSDIGSPSC